MVKLTLARKVGLHTHMACLWDDRVVSSDQNALGMPLCKKRACTPVCAHSHSEHSAPPICYYDKSKLASASQREKAARRPLSALGDSAHTVFSK